MSESIVHDLNEGWRRALRLQRFVYELKDAAWRSRSIPMDWRTNSAPVSQETMVTVGMTGAQLEAYRRVVKMLEEFDPGAAQVD